MHELTEKLAGLIGRGRWEEAESLLVSARDTARAHGDDAMTLSLESELMGFYRMHGQKSGFIPAAEHAMELLGRVRIDRRSRGTILINAATGMSAFGMAEKALELYREAETLYNAVLAPGEALFASLYNNMSSAFRALGDLRSAESYLLRAADVLRGCPKHPDLAVTMVNLAQLYADWDEDDGPERSRAALDSAWDVFDDPETVWDGYYAHTALKCAGAFDELGQAGRAAELRERAVIIYEGA